MVKEEHDHLTKRLVDDLPGYLNIAFKVDDKDVRLRLQRSRVNLNAPVFFLDDDGKMKKSNIADIKVRNHVHHVVLFCIVSAVHVS